MSGEEDYVDNISGGGSDIEDNDDNNSYSGESDTDDDIQYNNNYSGKHGMDSDIEDNYSLDHNIIISTEGIDDNDLNNNFNSSQQKNLKKCMVCYKNFAHKMVVDSEAAEPMCWHCLFWLNYDPSSRKDVDGNLGKTIADYILECHDQHNIETCTKRTDQGGCFLCEYKLGYVFTDINELWKIYDLNDINIDDPHVNINDEKDNFDDIEDEEIITVFI